MARYFDRTRAIEKQRQEQEERIVAIILALLAGLWRLLFPRIRDNRLNEIDAAFDHWAESFDEEYDLAVESAASALAESEAAWYTAMGKPIALDAEQIMSDYASSLAARTGRTPAQIMRDTLRRDMWRDIQQGNIERLQSTTLGASRAQGIARDTVTDVLGQVAMTGLQLSGTGWWVWQDAEDDLVCERCDEQHGSVHPATERFVKLHKFCRCMPTPLTDWLRARDQPFQGIAEGLAERAAG